MIIFDGYLTGESKKHFINKTLNSQSKLTVILLLFTVPIFMFLSIKTGTFIEAMVALFSLIVISPFILKLCTSKKRRQLITIKKVTVNDGKIGAISDDSTISNNINRVKEVRDYGEYYDIVFPSVYFASVYICQKNLLSKGTLEEFETIFSKKIVRLGKIERQSGDG